VVRVAGRLVGSVRARTEVTERGEVWEIGRLMVAPDLRGRGLGRVLLEHAERAAPGSATAYRLVTGAGSEANLRRYKRAGYRVVEVMDGPAGPAVLVKRISAR
jgi:tRNA (guanine37-N1)-methyltransferase